MNLTCKRFGRNNNSAVMIAIYCSMPWLYMSNSSSRHSSHPIAATVAALALVLVATLAAIYVCRKRRTTA